MPEKINELNIQNTKETIPEDKKQGREGPEIAKGEKLNKVTTDISEIKDKIDHDQPITEKNILELKEKINDLTIDIGDEKIPIKEIKNIENLKRTFEIFKEIEAGDFENYGKLTFITPQIVESLATKLNKDFYFNNLTSLSDNAAESLSKYKGRLLFGGLTSLSNKVAESLSKHEGLLNFGGLTSLSDNVAESLSKHRGGWLSLNGLTSLSDNVAESLRKHGEYLSLKGLTPLSDNATESLSKYKGGLNVPYYIQQQIDKFN